MSKIIHKLPYSLESEKNIIFLLINKPTLISEVIDSLHSSDFHDYRCKKIFDLLVSLYKQSRSITEPILTEELIKSDKEFDITFLVDDILPQGSTLHEDIIHIKQLAQRRAIFEKTLKLQQLLCSDNKPEDLVEEIDKSLFSLTTGSNELKNMSTILMEAFHEVEKRIEGKGIILTGFDELDEKTAGFLPGQLIIVGARTSIGKTSFALSLAHNALNNGKKVLFFSLEMPSHEIVMKSLSLESNVSYRDIISGSHMNKDQDRFSVPIIEAAKRISEWPFFIEDNCYSLNDIKSMARKVKKEHGIQFIVIDYLGLINTERYKESKVNELSYVTRTLKVFAKELNVPLMVLCQVNRESVKRANITPQLHDLRDSGSIEQDADIVLLLHREYFYNQEADIHDAQLIIAKQRLGATGSLNIHYEPGIMQFSDLKKPTYRY